MLRCALPWVGCLMLIAAGGCSQSAQQGGTPPTEATGSDEQTAPSAVETAQTPAMASPSEPASSTVEPAETAAAPASSASTEPTPAVQPAEKPAAEEKPAEPPPEVAGLKRFGAEGHDVWLDLKGKQVYVGGEVVRTEGQLEMFACLKNTKEHEAIVAVNTKAVNVNAALIAVGAMPGQPVQFRPEFKPASGPEIEVTVIWTNKQGEREKARAQQWIRDLKTGKALDQPWVFGGSGFWVDDNGKQHFMAEDGDFICISNFTSAMLDLPVESSQATAELQFEAFTERIPPVGTPVLLVLTPKLKSDSP